MVLTLIQTGGTIDKDYPKSIGGWNFEIGEAAFKRMVKLLPSSIEWNFVELLKKDSLELNQNDRLLILEACKKAQSEKIIITHGTDTLFETAKVLSTIENKTIVLTGAMRPERFSNSDAEINFGMALAGVQLLNPGVYIAIQGIIAPYELLNRNLETGLYYRI